MDCVHPIQFSVRRLIRSYWTGVYTSAFFFRQLWRSSATSVHRPSLFRMGMRRANSRPTPRSAINPTSAQLSPSAIKQPQGTCPIQPWCVEMQQTAARRAKSFAISKTLLEWLPSARRAAARTSCVTVALQPSPPPQNQKTHRPQLPPQKQRQPPDSHPSWSRGKSPSSASAASSYSWFRLWSLRTSEVPLHVSLLKIF